MAHFLEGFRKSFHKLWIIYQVALQFFLQFFFSKTNTYVYAEASNPYTLSFLSYGILKDGFRVRNRFNFRRKQESEWQVQMIRKISWNIIWTYLLDIYGWIKRVIILKLSAV